ncbi:MAG: Wzz/FepE/Etk N-terminal domain-containing protein [Prolixibacteraceae bacterium]
MTSQQKPGTPPPVADDEIDLLALVKTLWNGRKTVILTVIICAFLGLTVALLSPVQYTATTVMVPQVGGEGQSKLGGLGGLAALAGISLDMNQGNELSPIVYPQIVNSIPFQLELMKTPLNFKDHTEPISLFDYYTVYKTSSVLGTVKKYTIGLPGLLIKAIKGKPEELKFSGDSSNYPLSLSEDQVAVQKILEAQVSLDINAKDGYITLTTNMPEALAAAQLAQKAQVLLQKYITEFKIEKTKDNLNFIQQRYDETKAEFEKAQVSLALATDRNKNFTSGLPQIEIDRIQTRYTIAFSVFQELAKQLEQAKIQVKKDSPVFTIVEPVTVPAEKSKPKKAMILFIWIFLGGIIGTGIVFGREFLGEIKEKWNESGDK